MRRLNLLIVDDQVAVTNGLKEKLDGRLDEIGNIFTANSVEEAKLVMMSFEVDILLTDIEMPADNGLVLFEWTIRKYPDMVGVFLTSHAEFAYAKEAIRLGGFDYILQPARMEEIEAVLTRAVAEVEKKRKVTRLEENSVLMKDQREMILELLLIKNREDNQGECANLYTKLAELFSGEFDSVVFWMAGIKVIQMETRNNSWNPELIRLVFRNIVEELLEDKRVQALAVRENIGNYCLAAAAEKGGLQPDEWKKAMETFTSFINNHMDFRVAVFPEPEPSQSYDAKYFIKKTGGRPGVFWSTGTDDASSSGENDIELRIRKAQEYIRENIGRNVTRKEVADFLHINEDYFTRCFKKYTGYTFKDYDILVRMETAKTLLEQTKLPVSMIAGKVGFDNFSHFSQSFRKYSGKTPSEYR